MEVPRYSCGASQTFRLVDVLGKTKDTFACSSAFWLDLWRDVFSIGAIAFSDRGIDGLRLRSCGFGAHQECRRVTIGFELKNGVVGKSDFRFDA